MSRWERPKGRAKKLIMTPLYKMRVFKNRKNYDRKRDKGIKEDDK